MWGSVSFQVLDFLHFMVVCGNTLFMVTLLLVMPPLKLKAVRKPMCFSRLGLNSHAFPFLSSVNNMTPLLFDCIWLHVFSSSALIHFLWESITLKLRMCHCSLTAFTRLCSLCSSLVSWSTAWVAGSCEFSSVMSSLSAVLVYRASSFRTPRLPSLLLQYKRSSGVLMVTWRTTFMWFQTVWYMARMVVMGGIPGPFCGSEGWCGRWLGIVFDGV